MPAQRLGVDIYEGISENPCPISVLGHGLSTECMHSLGPFRHALSDLRPMAKVTYPAGVAIVGGRLGGCIWDIDGAPRQYMPPRVRWEPLSIKHYAEIYERDIACHLQPAALMTPSSTRGVYAIVQGGRSEAVVRGCGHVQLQQDCYSSGTTPTAAAVTAPFFGAALSAIAFSPS